MQAVLGTLQWLKKHEAHIRYIVETAQEDDAMKKEQAG
jgi:hypothetical protein